MHDAQAIDTVEGYEPHTSRSGVWAAVRSWGTSFAFHASALMLFGMIAFYAKQEEDPRITTVTRISLPETKPERQDPVQDPVKPTETVIEAVDEITAPESEIMTEIVISSVESENLSEQKQGDKAKVADMELASDFTLVAIGAGGGDAGKNGIPDGGGPTRAAILQRKKTNKEIKGTLTNVEAALRWFKKHQSPNGMWDVDGYQQNCTDGGGRCEPGTAHAGEDGDIACTAYALMCFLGAGYDHHVGTYRSVVKRGLEHLIAAQKPDGSFGPRNYEHAIATMAVCDALAMSGDRSLREPAQRGVAMILARQNADAKDSGYRLGWDYAAANPTRNDSSVTGWNVMALKSAVAAGLDVGGGLQGAKHWLEQAWKTANPAWAGMDPYKSRSVFPYTYDPVAATTDKTHLAAVGAMCAVFLGRRSGDTMLESLINEIMATDQPKSVAWPTNTYLLYYNTMAMFQTTAGGNDPRWKRWNEPVRNMISSSQRSDAGCFAGSWDFVGTEFHGHEVGRLLSTAYCCLSLEVYYRKDLVAR
ncbi:MAG: terpene cyclase/mutase family protein [Planctomycetes bacterium]|nr:terpene cyclase/mutase family protein [Planctomycetota bacterium]